MSLPSKDELKGKWKQQVGAAKIAWGKLTDDEILESKGHAETLAGLVQERYAVASDEAARSSKSLIAGKSLARQTLNLDSVEITDWLSRLIAVLNSTSTAVTRQIELVISAAALVAKPSRAVFRR